MNYGPNGNKPNITGTTPRAGNSNSVFLPNSFPASIRRSTTSNPLNESSPKSATTANDLLSVAETLALLERLRQSVREAVQRSNELEHDFTSRSHKLRAQLDQALAAERARWSSA